MERLTLIPLSDIEGYHSSVDENCSGVAYGTPVHVIPGTQKVCWRHRQLIREHDCSPAACDSALIKFVCACGQVFIGQAFNTVEDIR